MEYKILKGSVVGYKNILKNKGSQDYVEYKKINNGVICTVADGHSTDYFEYSDEGAKFACEVAIEVLESYVDEDGLELALKESEVQQLICNRWNKRVEDHYKSIYPIVFKTEYIKYSTTLTAVVITDKFRAYLKIGDGSIVLKENNNYKKIIDNNASQKIIDSIGREGSYKNIYYKFDEINNDENNLQWVILFSDGYDNSFMTKTDLYESIENTIYKYDKSIFSRMMLIKGYKNYLSLLSENISKDDISIIFIGIN